MIPRNDITLEKAALVSIIVEEGDNFKKYKTGEIIKCFGTVNDLEALNTDFDKKVDLEKEFTMENLTEESKKGLEELIKSLRKNK